MIRPKPRLAIVVSHPIQYYAPLYRRLAARSDLAIKVFFTWHCGERKIRDRGFGEAFAWDIDLTDGYDFEGIPNVASDPGTHHFLGLRNPGLFPTIMSWRPDAAHVTGWAWASHLFVLKALARLHVPTLFRGDSHLLDSPPGPIRLRAKQALLRRVYSWPAAFLVVGTANREYYRSFGVGENRLVLCPHSIDVGRFAEPAADHEKEAAAWRTALGIAATDTVLLYAGKFEDKKQPLALMRAFLHAQAPGVILVMVGGGERAQDVAAIAAADRARFRVLPFQNQSRMPVVYRIGDVFVLPSAYGETWGLGVNEALACGRPVLVSDRVGCAQDVIDASCGRVFPSSDSSAMIAAVKEMTSDRSRLADMRASASSRAWMFDVSRSEATLVAGLEGVLRR